MINEGNQENNAGIVVWDNNYNTGIELIDTQHKQLIVLTNELYTACRDNRDVLHAAFKEAMSRMVKYVRFHFDAELKLLKAINYPDYQNHKKKHDILVKDILDTAKDYNEGKKFVPNNFVRVLREWILSHIAVEDKAYSFFVKERIRKGVLTEKALKEFELSINS